MKTIVLAIIVALAAGTVACATTDINPPTSDPGNPGARTAPLSEVGASLAEDFDPLDREASTSKRHDAPEASHSDHEHDHDVATGQHSTAHEHGQPSADEPSKAVQKYTCPMHPEVVRDEPGKCPICGMKLVPMKKENGANAE